MSEVLAHQRLFEPTVSPAHDLNARIFVPAAAEPGASEIRARSFERLDTVWSRRHGPLMTWLKA